MWSHSLQAGGNSRSTAVRRVHDVALPVSGRDAAAANANDANSSIQNTKLLLNLADELDNNAMETAGAKTADDFVLCTGYAIHFFHYS